MIMYHIYYCQCSRRYFYNLNIKLHCNFQILMNFNYNILNHQYMFHQLHIILHLYIKNQINKIYLPIYYNLILLDLMIFGNSYFRNSMNTDHYTLFVPCNLNLYHKFLIHTDLLIHQLNSYLLLINIHPQFIQYKILYLSILQHLYNHNFLSNFNYQIQQLYNHLLFDYLFQIMHFPSEYLKSLIGLIEQKQQLLTFIMQFN